MITKKLLRYLALTEEKRQLESRIAEFGERIDGGPRLQ